MSPENMLPWQHLVRTWSCQHDLFFKNILQDAKNVDYMIMRSYSRFLLPTKKRAIDVQCEISSIKV